MFEEGKTLNDKHSFGGSWTRIKLEALEKYLAAFNTALSRQSFTRVYIDGFAGTGRCDITINGAKTSVDGSARRALAVNPPFNKFCFIEMDTKKMDALRYLLAEYPEKCVDLIQDDANTALKAICNNYNWKNTRAVLFLDPYGLHVEWSTLEAIAATKAIDVWYLFPYSGLYRQTAKNANAMDADKENSITRILGTDEWRQEFYKPQRQTDIFGDESGDRREADHHDMLNYVSKRLKELFPAVTEPKILFQAGDSKKPSGAPLFALYFAASNPSPKAFGLATKIAKDVLNAL
ncbi:MAG: three-Cys-motif partner protein TcmP [Methylicorpusculum sp.]|uniref:three-Cys-motif partner protein TcmP n=1 Tax=Methylicorpusculum sp. TaxID=2713644 RepID=UPI002730B7D2|nr:three-Cys-motif partner protein TcmP [Methylicorpusculum sp.]MDP2202244.1 three-Cys-motif partner protein TcmP [Methylicorpusculum sp.]